MKAIVNTYGVEALLDLLKSKLVSFRLLKTFHLQNVLTYCCSLVEQVKPCPWFSFNFKKCKQSCLQSSVPAEGVNIVPYFLSNLLT